MRPAYADLFQPDPSQTIVCGMSPAWRLLLTSIGALAIMGGIPAIWYFSVALPDLDLRLLFWLILIGGIVAVIATDRIKVILYADAVELQSLWSRRRIDFCDIQGRRIRADRPVLVLTDASRSGIVVTSLVGKNPALQDWLAGLADLDVSPQMSPQ